MKKFIRILTLIVICSLLGISIISLTACTSADYLVGISQFAPHSALDEATKGFVDKLTLWANASGKTIEFVRQNCNGEVPNAITVASNLIAREPDLILGNATPSAVALASKTSTIPLLFTAVTDPQDACLTASNISGTSDLNPVEEQVKLIKEIVEAKGDTLTKFGVLYCSSERNSLTQVNLVKEICKTLFPTVVIKEITVSQSSDLSSALSDANLEGLQALYLPTDNLIADNIATVSSKTQPKQIPLICGEDNMCKDNNTGLATLSISYYALGEQTAEIAIKVLSGEKKISDIPWQFYTGKNIFFINRETAQSLGYTTAQIDALQALHGGN
ncbi:MAG: ABC transporter substrate-binding protein [Clostridia bacterium]